MERRHAHLRIDGAIVRALVLPTVFDEVYRDNLIVKALEVERDARPIGGRGSEIGIKFHHAGRP